MFHTLRVAFRCAEWSDGTWSVAATGFGDTSELTFIALYVLVESTEETLGDLRSHDNTRVDLSLRLTRQNVCEVNDELHRTVRYNLEI